MNKEKTNLQHKYLEAFIERYTKRTKTSQNLSQEYRLVFADKSSLGFNFSIDIKEMCYPIVVERSLGSRLWDVDGNEYVDLLMGLGINLFGHNPPFIKKAIEEQLEKGIQIGPQAELAGEVAQLISEMTGMERVTFSNTGTEAVMTAIRLARAATNRSKIAMFTNSYHGHSDATLVRAKITEYAKKAVSRVINKKITPNSWLGFFTRPIQSGLKSSINPKAVPAAPGIPSNVAENVLVLDYGNPQSIEVIRTHQQELAAVLVEPVQSRHPELQPKEFLQQLRQVTEESGIALIFDEMVTGFRIHPGGAQAWFGVEADIATYSKIIGGGLPIAIIAGKATYMDRIDGGMWNYGDRSFPQVKTTFFAGTFCKHPLSLAAARAVLKHLKTQGASLQEQLNQRTSQLVERLNACMEAEEMPIQFTHFGSFFAAASSKSSASPMAMNLLSYHLIDRGVHLRTGDTGGFLSTAHTDKDIDYIIQAFHESVKDMREGGFLPSH